MVTQEKKLLCREDCYFEPRTPEGLPFVIKGRKYKVISIEGSTVTFESEDNPNHVWNLLDPEFSIYLELVDNSKTIDTDWSDKHYDFKYQLTEEDIANCYIKLDPYFVAKEWGIGSKDDSGVLIHNLKTIARFGTKNSIEREIKALHAQTVRMAELYGVEL